MNAGTITASRKRFENEVPTRRRPEPTKHVWIRRGLSWERGRPARMVNRGPAAHCGRDARAPRSSSNKTWLICEMVGVSRDPAAELHRFTAADAETDP